MKALSIRQPWAWLIAGGYKTIENRTWRTNYRGPLLIHASAYRELGYYLNAGAAIVRAAKAGAKMPPRWPGFWDDDLRYGGIIAVADLVDIVTESDDLWFEGPYGWVLRDVRRLPFMPCRGYHSIFNADHPEIPRSLAASAADS